MERLYITSPEDFLEFDQDTLVYNGKSYPTHQSRLRDTANPDGAFVGVESGRVYQLTKPGGVICTIPVNSYNFASFAKLQQIVRPWV